MLLKISRKILTQVSIIQKWMILQIYNLRPSLKPKALLYKII